MTTLQEQLDASQWWPADVLREQQLAQAAALIRHAAATAPFWRERLEPEGTLTIEHFCSLPLLERGDIVDAGPGFFSGDVPASHGAVFDIASSGSTGTPVRVRGSGMTQTMQQALSLRGYRWHDYDFSAKAAIIRAAVAGGPPPAKTTWSPLPGGGPSVLLDTALAFDALLDRLIEEEPDYLTSHPYTLLGLLEESERTGRRPSKLQKVRTLGEALEPRIRDLARRVWGVPVIDLYGAMEVGFIALQCPEADGLHVMSEGVLLEILDDAGEPCAPGESGRVVVTALHNYASPLIRYALGDYARVGAPCHCGRGLPVIDRVLGRQRNLLVLPSGGRRFVSEHLAGFAAAPYRQFRITQTALAEIEVTLVVPRPWSHDDEAALAAHLDRHYGDRFTYSFRYVEDIPRAASGKFEEFLSKVIPRISDKAPFDGSRRLSG